MGLGTVRAFLILGLVFAVANGFAEPRVDPETNVIRLLHVGKAWYQGNAPGPVFVREPKISWFPVPAHAWSMGEQAFRAMRLYLPRNREQFLEGYDAVLIDGMEALHLRLDFQDWVVKGWNSAGMNFVMADDSASFGTSGSHTSWYRVPLGEILPVEDKPVGGSPYGPEEAFHVVPVLDDHEFTNNIPWNGVWMDAANRPWKRQGATVLTRMSHHHPLNVNKVQMVYWDSSTGGGRSVAWIHRWVGNPEFWRWKYNPDVVANVIYFTARVPIPEDLVLVHGIREKIGDYFYGRLYAISTIEFADKFGANLKPVEDQLQGMDEEKAQADRLFIDQDYEGAGVVLDGVLVELEEVVQKAIEAKDAALFWIFLVEWLVVTGTSMFAGVLVWTLMVRRRLYKEVGETRLKMQSEVG